MKKDKEPKKRRLDLKDETKQGVLGILSFVLAIFFLLASAGVAGWAGRGFYRGGSAIFGYGYYLFPLCLVLLGISFLRFARPNIIGNRLIGDLALLLGSLGLVNVLFGDRAGGSMGYFISLPLLKIFDVYPSVLFLTAVIVIATLVVFDTTFTLAWTLFGRPIGGWFRKKEILTATKVEPWVSESKGSTLTPETDAQLITGKAKPSTEGLALPDEFGALMNKLVRRRTTAFEPPPLTLLERDTGKPGGGDIKANTTIIKRTLQNFGIIVEMDEVSIGPSITRYALKPAEGVKLSRIVALQNDLALALAAHPLRIEAPIPGRSLVGIEIPNSTKSTVGLASLLSAREFTESPHPLLVSLGRGISGPAHFANLAKAPHFLIAGATGSGKSVVIHTFITSLLYRSLPESLRFIMIDPKRVELTIYNKTPHLLTPVITDPKKAILSLKWAIKEMERRYTILERHAVRDVQSYHQNISEGETMPYIVIIIDELADIMASYPRELEAAIVRLAQMSRAVGIHLILSTQRPSVEVITGLIKANIPSRIALQVASQIDSRTILDMGGAEKLLGAGDMLYLAGDMSKPLRLQSAFISEREVKEVVKWLATHYGDELLDEIAMGETDMSGTPIWDDSETVDADDPLYEEARELVMESGKASASYLQRRLKVGYARAARLLDMLEERKVIGPGAGAKAREVYERSSSVINNDDESLTGAN